MVNQHKDERKFSTTDHHQMIEEERSNVRENWDGVKEVNLEIIDNTLNSFDRHLFLCDKQKGSYLDSTG